MQLGGPSGGEADEESSSFFQHSYQELEKLEKRTPSHRRQPSAIEEEEEQQQQDFTSQTASHHLYGGSVERTSLKHPNGKPVYLPRRDSAAPSDLKDFLKHHPDLVQRAQHVHRTSSQQSLLDRCRTSKCLTVLQGEVAHATSAQGVDILLSSEATTCHVLAVRSTSSSTTVSLPLASLAHMDACNAQDLHDLLQEHLQHHQEQLNVASGFKPLSSASSDNDDDFGFFDAAMMSSSPSNSKPGPSSLALSQFPSYLHATSGSPPRDLMVNDPTPQGQLTSTQPPPNIHVQLHIVGGFEDEKGTSFQLSKAILEEWAHLADRYADHVTIELVTAAISSLNTCPATMAPKARGLGIHIASGQVFGIAEELPTQLEGPALEVRSARLWARACCSESNQQEPHRLAVIHTRSTAPNTIEIEPFSFTALPHLDPLLNAPDPILKQITSTSPDYESDRFCSDIRRTVSFLNRVPSWQVFGQCGSRPLVFTRSSGNLHDWERKHDAQ
jgi:hypothetical protein